MATITSIVSLNQLVEWFQSFADRHYFLKDFGFGEPYDIGTTRQMEFPYMWLTLDDTSIIATGTNVKSAIPDYSFRVFFMDKINIQENYLDANGFQSDNSQQILSDTIQYLQDLITEIQQSWAQYGVMLSADVNFNPVIDETQDKSTGVSASITLRTRQVNCVIPVSPTNIVVQPSQQTYETLLTCENLDECSTFQTYAYTGGTFTGSTLTLTTLNGNTLAVTGFTGGGGSGTSGTSGTSGVGSGQTGYWGSFWSTQDQAATSTLSAYTITYNNTDPNSNGVSIVSNSRMTFANAGVYNIQFSAQADRVSGSGTDTIEIWFRKNGIDIPESNTTVTVSGAALAAKTVAAWNYMLKLSAGDYVELAWRTSDTRLELIHDVAATSPTRPAIPSVIATAQQVTNLQTGTGTSGTSGVSGTSGSSGIGSSGTSGLSGVNGTSGTSGTSGVGTNGSSGTSGVNGTSGTSGTGGGGGSSLPGIHFNFPLTPNQTVLINNYGAYAPVEWSPFANKVLAYPVVPAQNFTFSAITLDQYNTSASGEMIFALYDDLNNYPNNMILSSTTISNATGYAIKQYNTTYTLSAGTRYWLATAFNGSSAGVISTGFNMPGLVTIRVPEISDGYGVMLKYAVSNDIASWPNLPATFDRSGTYTWNGGWVYDGYFGGNAYSPMVRLKTSA